MSKLVADREKDIEFATALLGAELVSPEVLLSRADLLDQPGAVIGRVQDAIRRCARAAGYG